MNWIKRNVVSLFVVVSIIIFFVCYHLQGVYVVGSEGYKKLTIIFFSFSTGIAILSGIGLRFCIERFDTWHKQNNGVEEE